MRVSACAVWLGLGAFVSGGAAATEAVPDEQGPDIELLQYLGDLVEEHDRLVGPDDMQGVVDTHESRAARDGDAADAGQVK